LCENARACGEKGGTSLLSAFFHNPNAPYTYFYDADSVRIRKAASSTVGTFYWPGANGEILTEANGTGTINEEYIYFDGERIARVDRPSGTVHYYFSDDLGSASVVTNATGGSGTFEYYYPFGGLVSSSGSDPNHYLFTGKERDNDSGEFGLDYFGARHYASMIGRFMTPDWEAKPTAVPYASLGNPQSLNLYSYVNNNPTTMRDPDGHCLEDACLIEGLAIEGGIALWNYVAGGAVLSATVGIANSSEKGAFSDFYTAKGTTVPASMPTDVQSGTPGTTATNVPQGTPGTETTNVTQGTPGSTSQEGVVNTDPKASLPKSATGPGTVPKDQRDPHRAASDREKAEMRQEQKGNCAHCDKPMGDEKGIGHHTPVRHADGGKGMKLVHEKCHKSLHSCS
jgi:RHS repeat-associated protein